MRLFLEPEADRCHHFTLHLPQGDWEEDVFEIASLDGLLPPTLQSEEDKQLQDELEMLVERLGVSHSVNKSRCI